MKTHVLLVDDDPEFRRRFSLLGEEIFHVTAVADAAGALEIVSERQPDAVLLDVDLGAGMSGIELLGRLQRIVPDVPVIMVSGDESTETIVAALRAGARDYISKRPNLEMLRVKIENALRDIAWRVHARHMQSGAMSRLVGESPPMQKLRGEIKRAAQLKIRVLIAGESGTGKELVARALHEESPRAHEKFVVYSGAEGSDDLVDSELFGHEKGAFTGALERRIGRFELASGGTIFLDEVGKMPLARQAKLLRAIETGHFDRLGGHGSRESDARVLSASNEDLERAIADGRFLADFLFRIQEYRIDVPSLRERLQDIPALMGFLVRRFAEEQGLATIELDAGALEPLYDYTWPGNIRELDSVLKTAWLEAAGGAVRADDVAAALHRHRRRRIEGAEFEASGSERVPLAAIPSIDPVSDSLKLVDFARMPYAEAREAVLDVFDEYVVTKALARAGGNCAAATRLLGVSRSTFYRIIARLGIHVERE